MLRYKEKQYSINGRQFCWPHLDKNVPIIIVFNKIIYNTVPLVVNIKYYELTRVIIEQGVCIHIYLCSA